MIETFSIRCFRGRRRKLTHELTKREAAIFYASAKHLARYLRKTYKLKKP